MNTMVIHRIGSRAAGALLGIATVLAMLVLVTVQQAAAQENQSQPDQSFKECTDGVWAEYNSCLMESSWWFSRLTCDLSWELDMVECGAEEVGEIRGAFAAH